MLLIATVTKGRRQYVQTTVCAIIIHKKKTDQSILPQAASSSSLNGCHFGVKPSFKCFIGLNNFFFFLRIHIIVSDSLKVIIFIVWKN